MSKTSVSFDEIKAELMEDEEFKAEYEKLRPRYEMIEQIIQARHELHMIQSELAKKVGTQKSNISSSGIISSSLSASSSSR